MKVVAYDFDGSISLQQSLLLEQGVALDVKSMRRFERSARLWASANVFRDLCEAVPEEAQPCFSLIGSGDYHHVTLALLKKQTKPLTLVLFDNHPDWMRPPHQYHCGSWVYSAARLDQVKRIIIIGLESGDISALHFKKGDTESYLNGKTVLLPYQPVTVFLNGEAQLHSLLAKDFEQGVAEILDAIPTQDVYLSVDKDCLSMLDVKTNWEQGSLRLSTVIEVIRRIVSVKTIVGADSVGDFSLPKFNSPLKWLASLLDRRENPMFNLKEASRQNAMANVALIQALET